MIQPSPLGTASSDTLNNIPKINIGARSANAPLTQSYDKGPDVPLIEATIGDFFDAIVAKYPEREALVVRHQNIRWTYKQLQGQVNKLASAIIEMGLEIGDRIGIWSHNNSEWLLMQLATAKVGVILVNINPAYRTFELQYALNKLGCSALVLMRHFKTSDYTQMIRELCPEIYHKTFNQLDLVEIPTVERIIWIDEPEDTDDISFMQKFSDWIAEGDANNPRVKERQTMLKNTDAIVKAATGEEVSAEDLGGGDVHTRLSGVVDYLAQNDTHALSIARDIAGHLNRDAKVIPNQITPRSPRYDAKELYGIIPTDKRKPFDIKEIIARIVDDSAFDEFKARFANTLICGFAHIEGMPVGIIANNGILFSESAQKSTHFIELCCKRKIPLVFLQNITGFMVGRKYENEGIARHGAKMVMAVANAKVTKFIALNH